MKADTLVVLGTGGTIAGRSLPADRHGSYRAGVVAVADLLGPIPVPTGWQLESHQVAQIDSKDMGAEVWKALLRQLSEHLARPEVRGIVVTHGTDTLEETAYLLQRVLAPGKPVVLTCAMRAADALLTDGPQNLADALSVAACPGAHGVVVVCAGRIHSALQVQKVHTHRLDAFDSGDAGALGEVVRGAVTRWQDWPLPQAHASAWLTQLLGLPAWPRVECILSHAGSDGAVVRALLSAPDADRPRGLVVGGTGNGTLHQALEAALTEAEAAGLRVWRTTRCAYGRVSEGMGSRFPVVPLPLSKARIALMLDLL